MIHTQIPDGDFVVYFPPAAERARLRALEAASRSGVDELAGLLAPAVTPSAMDGVSETAGALLFELPLLAFDRPGTRPAGKVGGEGESPPPVPDTVGASNCPAAGFSPSSSAAVGQIELPGTGPGGSIAAVLQKRLEHIAQGFTPEADDARSLKELTTKLRFYADDARAFAFNPRVDGDHAAMRNKLVNVGALALALIDRLDRAGAHP